MEFLVISVLILLNGFFALSEIALVSGKRSRFEQLRSAGSKGASTALRLIDDSEGFLSAIQVGITLIGIITGAYGGISIADDVAPLIQKTGLAPKLSADLALVLTVGVITFFSIVIGELVPKTVAMSDPERIAVKVAPVIHFITILFYPVVRFLSYSTSLVNRLLGIRKRSDQLTEAELRNLLRTASREGIMEKEQNLIHNRVFYFSDKKAKHIMTHRMELEWIDLDKPFSLIKEAVTDSRHSRIICARGNLDNFLGFINVKDFIIRNYNSDKFDSSLLIQPLIVPESADARGVLRYFREGKVNFCMVVNEFGSPEGIITPHDILENLIGDIPEEGELPEPDIFIREDRSALVNGDAPAEVLEELFDDYIYEPEETPYSTVAGFVLDNLNKMPETGDKFRFKDYIIEIIDLDGNRIDKVLVRKDEK
jgi:putative hemolysin